MRVLYHKHPRLKSELCAVVSITLSDIRQQRFPALQRIQALPGAQSRQTLCAVKPCVCTKNRMEQMLHPVKCMYLRYATALTKDFIICAASARVSEPFGLSIF